jgi:hypothetical protein
VTTADREHEDYHIPHTTTCSRCAKYHTPVRQLARADEHPYWVVDSCGISTRAPTARMAVDDWNLHDLVRVRRCVEIQNPSNIPQSMLLHIIEHPDEVSDELQCMARAYNISELKRLWAMEAGR